MSHFDSIPAWDGQSHTTHDLFIVYAHSLMPGNIVMTNDMIHLSMLKEVKEAPQPRGAWLTWVGKQRLPCFNTAFLPSLCGKQFGAKWRKIGDHFWILIQRKGSFVWGFTRKRKISSKSVKHCDRERRTDRQRWHRWSVPFYSNGTDKSEIRLGSQH